MYSDELLYPPIPIVHPTYEYTKIYPQTNIQTLAVTNGGDETIFEIPVKVFNLAKSVLSFTMTPTVATTLTGHIFAEGTPHLRSIQLYNRSGLFLCNITHLNKYMGSVTRYVTDQSYFKTFDKVASSSGYMDVLKTNDANISLTSALLYAARLNLTPPSSVVDEPSYLIIDPNLTPAINKPVVRYQIPLGRIKDSIFGIDKDQCFNEVVYMRLVWENAGSIGFSTTGNSPGTVTGAAALNGYSITQQFLYLAVEVNPELVSYISNEKIRAGFTYQVPYLYTNKIQKADANTSQSISIRLNRSHGIKVKRIYFVPFIGDEALNTTLNHAHSLTDGGTGIQSYYTTIDNKRTSQYDYNADNCWLEKKNLFKNSCINGSSAFFNNWLHIEDFTNMTDLEDNSRYDDGRLLSNELVYNVTCQNEGVALYNYFFSSCIKQIMITPQGMTLT